MKHSFHRHTLRTAIVEFLAEILVRSYYVEWERERETERNNSFSFFHTYRQRSWRDRTRVENPLLYLGL